MMGKKQFLSLFPFLLRPDLVTAQPPPSDELCLVCLDGSSPLQTEELLDEVGFGADVSCETLAGAAEDLISGTEGCNVLQLTALQGDCCPNSSGSNCTLCPDGSEYLAFPSRLLPSPFDPAVFISCNEILQNASIQAELLADFVDEAGVCENTLLRRTAGHCGCPGVSNTCDLCSGGELKPDQVFPLTNTVCNEVAYEVSLLPSGQCQRTTDSARAMAGFDTAAFCCSNVPRPDQCRLCPIRSQLVGSRAVTTELYGEVTCANLQNAASLTTNNAACEALKEQSGGQCCVELPNANPCELVCPNGSAPPELLKQDPVTGYTCQSLATEFAKFSADQCGDNAVAAVGFDAVAFCCPGAEPPNECSICESFEELLYPERILFAYDENSCADLSRSLRYMVGDTCRRILDDSRATRNCQCRPEFLPTLPPISIPNQAEGGGGSGAPARSFCSGDYLLPAFGVTCLLLVGFHLS